MYYAQKILFASDWRNGGWYERIHPPSVDQLSLFVESGASTSPSNCRCAGKPVDEEGSWGSPRWLQTDKRG
ncbi:hypothetical protein [Halocatena marina]|uniref:hypothetical protein n=1 Tax=Halocatena marina TaxID=2934937 RepID=UPI0036F44392